MRKAAALLILAIAWPGSILADGFGGGGFPVRPGTGTVPSTGGAIGGTTGSRPLPGTTGGGGGTTGSSSALISLALSLGAGSEPMSGGGAVGLPGMGSAWPKGLPAPVRGKEPGWKFMPAVPPDLLEVALGICAGHAGAPYQSPEFLTAASLIQIGEPSLLALSAARGLGSRGDLLKYVESSVQPVADRPLMMALPATPAAAMAHRMAFDDLTASHPYARSVAFAPRLCADRSILVSALPRLLDAAKHAHPFLRRNAVHLLGTIASEPAAQDELCRILDATEDAVCRYRALLGLMGSRSPRVGTILRGQVRTSKDGYWRNYALFALGFIDPSASRDLALETLQARRRDDDDAVWAALQCLFGSLPLDDAAQAEVRRLEASFAAAEGSEDGVIGLAPSLRPYRACMIRRISWCLLALSGDTSFQDRVVRSLENGRLRRVLSRFPGSWAQAIEVLAQVAPRDLWKIADDGQEDPEPRGRAILRMPQPDPSRLTATATSPKVPLAVRAAAMTRLGAEGAPAARQLVEAYGEGLLKADETTAAWVALAAARHLSEHQAADAGLFLKALERALRAREEGTTQVPLVEGILGMLSSSDAPEATAVLRKLLKSGRTSVAGEAALALGESAAVGVEPDLLAGLEAEDGWIRFCSYTALKRRLNQESDCDWIYSSAEARRPFVKTWKARVGK